jgi:hypothetical protein
VSVVGGLHGIEIVCTGRKGHKRRMPHDEWHVASVLEVLGRSPEGPGVERTRHGWRLICGWRDEHRQCRQNWPIREASWQERVAEWDATDTRRVDLSGMR